MDASRLGQDSGKFVLRKSFTDQKFLNSLAARETLGNGGSRNYANSQSSSDQNRHDTNSKVSAVQNRARGPR